MRQDFRLKIPNTHSSCTYKVRSSCECFYLQNRQGHSRSLCSVMPAIVSLSRGRSRTLLVISSKILLLWKQTVLETFEESSRNNDTN